MSPTRAVVLALVLACAPDRPVLAGPPTGGAGSLDVAVMDPHGLPVDHASVTVVEPQRELATGPDGQIRFDALPAGQYTVVAAAPGFEPVTEAGVRVSPGVASRLEIRFRQVRSRQTQVDVVGEAVSLLRQIPGSVDLISREAIAASHSVDANELLRRVPGVTTRQDSGPVGMRLNVGIRGLNPDRSRQVLVLEDGLPIALAPYGEPEMYYSPPIERMQRVEIVKGSGSILYGPQTVGGVLNFVTPDPPARPRAMLSLTGGSDELLIGHGTFGTTAGRVGVFAGGLRKQGDGFRQLRFDLTDVTAKATVGLGAAQSVGLKVQAYDEASNSTYLGLTQSQFDADPRQNLVPDDSLTVRRLSGSAHHRFVAGTRTAVSTSAFVYDTERFWRRQDFDRARSASASYVRVGGDPGVPGGAVFVRGTSTSRDREFRVAGVETRVSRDHVLFGLRQSFEGGGHYVFERALDRQVIWTEATGGTATLRDAERRPAHAFSLFAQNRVSLGERLTVTPGVRGVRYAYERHITTARVNGVPVPVDVRGGDRLTEVVPGVGATLLVRPDVTVFGGAHRGFAPPRVKDAITASGQSLVLDAERSWNYEAGLRWDPRGGLRLAATAFVLDFTNQIIPAAQSGGATTTLVNAGETLHRGLEVDGGLDVGRWLGRRYGLDLQARATWLPTARFERGVFAGHRLPYAPRTSLSGVLGYRHPHGFALQLDATRAGAQFGDNAETVTGSNDGTIGRLPSYVVWNVAAEYRHRAGRLSLAPFVSIKNLTDRVYIASRAPEGIQPGPFRQTTAGVRAEF
jgi:Fe(3+) dicitrate transport protein